MAGRRAGLVGSKSWKLTVETRKRPNYSHGAPHRPRSAAIASQHAGTSQSTISYYHLLIRAAEVSATALPLYSSAQSIAFESAIPISHSQECHL